MLAAVCPAQTGTTSIPSTWNTGHPRLPHPDQAYLLALAANSTEMAKYDTAAANFDPTNPPSTMGQFRRALIAYLANQAAGNTTLAAADLAKFEQLANLGGTWGQLLYAVNDGVGNGTYTITSASANFLTGCGGSTCGNGNYILSIEGRKYSIVSATQNSIVLKNASNPPPSGTGIQIRIFNGYQGYTGLRLAMVYDWLYNYLDSADRTAFMNQLEVNAEVWEEYYTGLDASPYNDQVYIENGPDGFIAAFAIYPDFDNQNPTGGQCSTKPCGTYHLNWMMNKLFNVFVPVWHQVFGNNGGAWSEDWSQYANNNPGLDQWLVPILLSWESASGQTYFEQNTWLKNYATWTMYVTRPDFTMEHIGEVAAGTLTPEYYINYDLGAGLGSLNGLAEIYNDPVLRGWARLVNQEFTSGPSGFEPSAWPFYTPDSNSKSVLSRAALPVSKDFDGWGVVFARTGWTENDTDVSLKYGDNFWSHTHGDAGSFTISHRGNLAINSGTYRAGSNSEHEIQYGKQAISQNTLLIIDPKDVYPNQPFGNIFLNNGTTASEVLANDGGQRRAGTFYNELFPQYVSPDCLNKAVAPGCTYDWQSEYDYYHMGTLLSYTTTPTYTYAAVDITPAYNNPESATTPNSVNRTNRAQSVIRNMLFIPNGTSAYVVVYDEVASTNAAFQKKWLLHSINQPIISGNRYEIDRAENVTQALNWTNQFSTQLTYANGGTGAGGKYQYNGKLIGWMLSPAGGTITTVGGPGKEFWIDDPANPGSGNNWNACMQGQCSGPYWGFIDNSSTTDIVSPSPSVGPIEPGSWRIEETPSTPEQQDYFLNVILATDYTNTNVPASVAPTSDTNTVGATWSDANNTYTISFPRSGTGGTLTITGAVNVTATLPAGNGSSSGSSSPAVAALSCAPASLSSGQSATCTVTLSQAAPASGATVTLTSNSSAVTVPASVVVSSGATAAAFTATAGSATGGQTASVTAAFAGTSQSATLTLTALSTPGLSSVSCAPATVAPGQAASCTVTLSAAGTAATVMLGSNSQTLAVPASVVVSAGASTATFPATASASATSAAVTITATLGTSSVATAVIISAPASSGTGTSSGGSGGTSVTSNTWTMVPTNGFPAAVVGYENLVYASGVKKFFMWDNYHNITSESNEAMLSYDFSSNRWDLVGLVGNFHSEQLPESGHPVGLLQYDPNLNILISYCCQSGSQGYERPEHTWIFDPVGLTGRDAQTAAMPGLTSEASAAFDTAEDLYVLYDRGTGTWTYNPATNVWTNMNPSGTPPAASGFFASAYDSKTDKIYLFGGITGANTYTSDMYMYDLKANSWTKLNPGGTLPAPRQYAGFAYDSTNDVFLMVSGANGSGVLTDTWAYNPSANTWTLLAATLPSAPMPSYQRLAYDSDDNIFVLVWTGTGGYANGPAMGYASAQTWFFRYAGSGPNPGSTTVAFPAPAGSNNLHSDAWANEPALASSGSSLFLGWSETGEPFDSGNQYYPHVYGSTYSNSAWTSLGTNYLALDSEFNGFDEAHSPSMTAVNGTPWISWYKTSNSGQLLPNSLYAKYWNGSSWVGGAVGVGHSTTALVVQGRSQMASAGNIPYIAFLENDRSCYPWCQYLYVKQWNAAAGTWNLVGTGTLNRNAASSTGSPLADSVAITTDGTNPIVAWTEYIESSTFEAATAPQVYVDTWNGTSWVSLGASLNSNPAGWAYDASIAYLNGQPYVAWVERTQGGVNQLFVKTWNGNTWGLVGTGPLNQDANTGWAFRPSLVSDPSTNTLYVGWVEQQALGKPAQTYVAKYSNGAWTVLGGSLNTNPSAGSSERVNLAVLGGQLVAAWGEVQYGTLRQIFVKEWNGSVWGLLTSVRSCDLNGDGVVNSLDVQLAVNQAIGAAPCSSADLQGTGTCDVVDVQRVIEASLGQACVIGH